MFAFFCFVLSFALAAASFLYVKPPFHKSFSLNSVANQFGLLGLLADCLGFPRQVLFVVTPSVGLLALAILFHVQLSVLLTLKVFTIATAIFYFGETRLLSSISRGFLDRLQGLQVQAV